MSELLETSDGLQLCVSAFGDPANPPVLLVHGYPDVSQTWRQVVDHLADDYYVVFYDTRGNGASSTPKTQAGYDLALLCDDIDILIGHLGGSVHLVGHDWGSVQAFHYVADTDADTGNAHKVRSFTSISGPHLGITKYWAYNRPKEGWRGKKDLITQLLHSWYIFSFKTPKIPELVMGRRGTQVRRMFNMPEPDGISQEVLNRSAANGVDIYRQNVRPADRTMHDVPAAGSITTPTQLIVPLGDIYVRPVVHSLTGRFVANLTRHDIEGGHWVTHENPELIASLIKTFARANEPTGSEASSNGQSVNVDPKEVR